MVWNTCMYAVLYSEQDDTTLSMQENIDNEFVNNLSIPPNPAKNEINLIANFGTGFLNGALYDVTGKQIKQFNGFATHRGKNIIVNRLKSISQ